MTTDKPRLLATLLVIALSVASTAAAQVTPDRLVNASREPQQWLTYSGSYDGTRYTALDQINGVDRIGAIGHVAEDRHAQAYAPQRILDLVGQLRRRLAHCRQGFGPPQDRVRLHRIRDIDQGNNAALLAIDVER